MKKEEGNLKKLFKIFDFNNKNFDFILLGSVLVLTSLGMLMVYSTSSIFSLEKYGDSSHFLKLHTLYLTIGIISLVIFMHVDYKFLRKMVYPIYILGLILLVLVLIPGIGKEVSGAQRWIQLSQFTFQPSELCKFILVLYLAHSLTKKKSKIDSFWVGFFSHIVIAGLYIFLIFLEPDFGTSSVLLIVLFIMLFIGNVRLRYLLLLGLISVAFVASAILTKGYRMDRVTSFMDPWKDPLGSGYQTVQSFVAFGLGGLYGTGLGDSSQKLFFLPQAHTDFIFSIMAEEFGFIGVVFILLLFFLVLIRSIRISLRAPDSFSSYLVFGIIVLIIMQASINMGVAVGLFPTKGITLPFISYGGSSLISSLAAIGIILSISRHGKK
ncbi:MAG: putative lipid II flippase FtsW [Candidatus Dadabacteria bacterium]|nr:putative lipid II flippase FtsW [Candidatus Dadabacteria bacterium]NIQ15332.1 putative lipid II flippase FtsW [Candidatus Dadabacteria bacterium]